MMENSHQFLIPLENDESIAAKTSLTFDSSTTTPSSGSSAPSPQPKFDSLLDKLRKGMSELTSKGDDFTKQMFQMYNTLEDIIHSSKMNDNNSRSLDQIFVVNNQTTNTDTSNSKSNTLKINNNCINNSVISNSDENLVNANNKSGISQSNQSFHSSIDSNDSNFSDFCQQNIETKLRTNNICNNNNNNVLNSSEKSRLLNVGNNPSLNSINNESINSLNTFGSNNSLNILDNSSDKHNITNNLINNTVVNNNQLSVRPQSDSVRANKRLILKEKKRILQELDITNGYINRNCLNSGDRIVNPLLDTINTLTSCSDSSDEFDISKKCYPRSERHRRIFNNSRHLNRKSTNNYYSSSDAESVSGYTGTNSLESGYKSDYLGSHTYEVIDGNSLSSLGTVLDCSEPSVKSVSEGVNHSISHQMTGNESLNTLKKKSTSKKASNESSAMNLFEQNSNNNHKNYYKFNEVLSEKQQNQNRTPDDMSSNASVDSFQTNSSTTNTNNSQKSVGMFSEKIANRLKAFNNDSQLEHLLKLRKSLLKALKRCEQISSPANSRDGSPITAGISVSVSSRSSSPASTIVKNTQNSTSNPSNSRRLRDEINCRDKCRQKSVLSPLTIRSHEELERSCDQLSTYSMSSMNSTSSTNSSKYNTINNKSVRFNGSVVFSPVCNQNDVKTKPKQQISGNYVSNKSILKDPLCETLRSSINAGEFTNNCSLEGEIDELLYGRTGPYYYSPSLEPNPHLGLDECLNPLSSIYVSRVEEKYRTFTNSGGHTSKQSSIITTAANSKKTSASSSKDNFAKTYSSHLNDIFGEIYLSSR